MQGDAASAGHVERQELVVLKTRGITDRVGRMERAVDRDDALGHDSVDAGTNEIDVRFLEALEPAAVVLEDALAHGRVVGGHLFEQVGSVAEVFTQPVEQVVPNGRVGGVDRAVVGVDVIGVDAKRFYARSDAGLGHHEPQPTPEKRQVLHGPGFASGHFRVVDGVGHDPLCRALKDRQVFDFVRDRGGDLESARAGAE